MAPAPLPLSEIVGRLATRIGPLKRTIARGAYQLVLWESVGYLIDDDRRATVWRRLAREVGLRPVDILRASREALVEVLTDSGMHRELRARRLQEIAARVAAEHDGDLEAVLQRPLAEARRALKAFPAIGDPGVDKILLFTGTAPILALDSNGLRVLLRLGWGMEAKSYSTSYRSVQRALAAQTPSDCAFLRRAHELLRIHGQTTCRRTRPDCAACVLACDCPSAGGRRLSAARPHDR